MMDSGKYSKNHEHPAIAKSKEVILFRIALSDSNNAETDGEIKD